MIYENNININDSRTFAKQVEDLTEGRYYLMNPDKWEKQRINLKERYYNGKIGIKEYTSSCVQLIRNVVSNIEKEVIFASSELPF